MLADPCNQRAKGQISLARRRMYGSGEVALEEIGGDGREIGFVSVFDHDRQRTKRFVEQGFALRLQPTHGHTHDGRSYPALSIRVQLQASLGDDRDAGSRENGVAPALIAERDTWIKKPMFGSLASKLR